MNRKLAHISQPTRQSSFTTQPIHIAKLHIRRIQCINIRRTSRYRYRRPRIQQRTLTILLNASNTRRILDIDLSADTHVRTVILSTKRYPSNTLRRTTDSIRIHNRTRRLQPGQNPDTPKFYTRVPFQVRQHRIHLAHILCRSLPSQC